LNIWTYIVTQSDYCTVFREDLLELVCLCHAALAQDSPEPPTYYINQILNISFGYLPVSDRPKIDEYLAEKKYLPPAPKIEIVK
jgi:hypothetical protein